VADAMLHVRVPDDLRRAAEDHARSEERTLSAVVRRALRANIDPLAAVAQLLEAAPAEQLEEIRALGSDLAGALDAPPDVRKFGALLGVLADQAQGRDIDPVLLQDLGAAVRRGIPSPPKEGQ
jgi:hypothetical protein